MVRFHIGEVEVFFPYEYVYSEQLEYMRQLKATLDAKGHCVLEMPTGTGKTVALLSLITSYQLAHPEVGKLIYCTRTVPEMEKALAELKVVVQYQLDQMERTNDQSLEGTGVGTRLRRLLGLGMTSRRNLCIHPEIAQEADRDKVDERCAQLTAPWIRRRREEQRAERKRNAAASAQGITNATLVGAPSWQGPQRSSEGVDIEDVGGSGVVCPFYENYERYWSPSLVPSGVYTLSSMKEFGTLWRRPDEPDKCVPFCPYFASRRLIQIANVVVLNYQYVLDPKVSQAAFMGGIGPTALPTQQSFKNNPSNFQSKDPSIIVFDEAHNIDNVCIEAFSINLNMVTLEKAKNNINKLDKMLKDQKSLNTSRLIDEYNRLVSNLRNTEQVGSSSEGVESSLETLSIEQLGHPILPEDILTDAIPGTIRKAEYFLSALRRLIFYLSSYSRVFSVKSEGPLTFLKNLKDELSIDPKTLKFCYDRLKSLLNTLEVTSLDEFTSLTLVCNFLTLIGTYYEGFIVITDPYPEAEGLYDPLIQLSCLDSSLAMKPVLAKFQSVILTSGTISPLFLYPKLLGFEPVITKSLNMSLDRDCICPLIIAKGSDQVPLSSRFDLRSDQAVLRNFGSLLVDLVKTVPDGVVCFFTSYSFMEMVIAQWYEMGIIAEVMKRKLILMETKDVVATTLALHSYRRACDSGRGAVFFSVARGKVAEGIDFDRHYGRAVVLFGIPYQYTLSRILKARLDYMRENYQISESEFLTFDAMRQSAQCVGRIIRSKNDYGLMLFADYRYSRNDKRSKLPQWILKYLDPSHMALSTDVALTIANKFLMEMAQPFQPTTKSRLTQQALDRLQKKKDHDKKIFQKDHQENETDNQEVFLNKDEDSFPMEQQESLPIEEKVLLPSEDEKILSQESQNIEGKKGVILETISSNEDEKMVTS